MPVTCVIESKLDRHTPFSVCAPTAAGMRKVPALQVVQAPVFASQELQLRGKTVHDWHMPGVPNLPAGHSAGHEVLGQADAGCRQHKRETLHNAITLSSFVGANEDVKWTMGVDGK